MAMAQGSGRRRSLGALRHRDYRWYFASGMGMSAAQGIQDLAITWLVLDLTESLSTLVLVIFVRGLTMLTFGLFGGAFADRYSRRNLLIVNQVLTLANMAAIALLVFGDQVQIWQVYGSSLMLGLTTALTGPARTALIRSLVPREDMLNAVALNSFQMNLSRIVWPTLAGVLIAITGTGGAFAVCAIASVFGIVFILPVKDTLGHVQTGQRSSAFGDVKDGLRYIWSIPTLAMIMTMILLVGMFGLCFQTLASAFARESMEFDSKEAGFFLMAAGIGAIIGSTLLIAREVKNRNLLFMQTIFGFGASVFLLALNPTFIGAYLLMGVFGVFSAMTPVLAQTIFQVGVPQQYLGRVNSLFMIGPGLAAMLTLPVGIVGDLLTLRVAIAGIAAILMLIPIGAAVLGLHHRQLAEPEPDARDDRRLAGAAAD
ncbi:MAG: MFS transporter [Dehalococcoidia bacterium]